MTKEQKKFLSGQKVLKMLDDVSQERPLTQSEKNKAESIKMELFNSVIRFGLAEAKKRMARYRLNADAYQEIYQGFAKIFFERLPYYNPSKSTPTTYFVRYFDQVISEYLHAFSQNLSQYDSHNVAIVRAAIHEFEAKGIKWNEEMIVARTKLSTKVTRQTIIYAQNSIYADIEDAPNLTTTELTPEEIYLYNEKQNEILNALKNNLEEDEIQFFLYKVNLNGKREKNYKELGDHFKITDRKARQIWNNIIGKLRNVKELRGYAKKEDVTEATVTLSLEAEKELVESSAAEIFDIMSNNEINVTATNDS